MEQIEYTRTVVPSSMRSPYWKYFGFPSDNSNNILTRQKIVCTVCNTAIAYNKNTSNLRTHLMSKHVEIFKKIVTPSNDVAITNQNTICYQNTEEEVNSGDENDAVIDYVSNLNDAATKRQRIQTYDDKNHYVENCLALAECDNLEHESSINRLSSPPAQSNQIDSETHSTDFIAFLTSNDSEMVTVAETSPEVFNTSNLDFAKDARALTYTNVDLNEDHEKQLQSMGVMLADLIQADLLNLDTLTDQGFCKYNQQLTGLKIDGDTIERVKLIIESRFRSTKQIISSHLNRLSHSQPYSLSFEIYKDNEAQEVLNIYFNYLNDKEMDLISILYASTTISTKGTNISELLAEINLENCSAIVITSLENMFEFVSDFTKSYDLPLIECLDSMLDRCLQKIFDETEFNADYEKFLKIIFESGNEINLKKSVFRTRCNWSRLNFLEYIFQNVEENKLEQCCEFRRSFEYLKPLKIALDIIADEPLPLCSLSRPLIKKLFEEHFNSTNQVESRISQIQKILEKELYERIMTQRFLNEVTFFDTRFHRDALSDRTNVKTQILKRFSHILQLNYINRPNNFKVNHNSADSIGKCSSLKSFFKRDGASLTNTAFTTDEKTNLDLEFEQYHIQPCLDLDQSPVLWWQQQSNKYIQLSKIAKHYLTIPCCCLPRLCRIDSEQRYVKLDRRKNLSQFCTTESKLWYLYYNDDATVLL